MSSGLGALAAGTPGVSARSSGIACVTTLHRTPRVLAQCHCNAVRCPCDARATSDGIVRAMDARLARAIFVTTFAVYLLSSGREPPWGDGNIQYMMAESLVHRGALDVPRPWPDDLPPRNGKFYTTYPLGTAL